MSSCAWRVRLSLLHRVVFAVAASALAPLATRADVTVYSSLDHSTGGVRNAHIDRIWDDLNLVGGGVLSEVSWYANNGQSGDPRSFTGNIELRAFPDLSVPPSTGALLGTIENINPTGLSLAQGATSLVTLSNLTPLNINLTPDSRIAIGLKYDQSNFFIRYDSPATIGTSGPNYWAGDTQETSFYGGSFGWQLKTLTGPTTTVASTPLFDAEGESSDGLNYTVHDGSQFIEAYESPDEHSRGLMEFDLSTIPTGAQVTEAALDLHINGWVSSGGLWSQLDVYGYVGNGTLEGDDALQTSTLLAGNVDLTDGGPISIALNTAELQALLEGGDYLGLTVVGARQYFQATFASSEYHASIPNIGQPTLRISYVPEPTTLAILPLGLAAGLLRRR